MATPKFRFGGYMNKTSGGTNSNASSNYGGGGGGGQSYRSGSSSNNNDRKNTSSSSSSVGQTIYNNTARNEDGLTQAEVNKIKNQSKAANEAAYNASKEKQKELAKAIAFMNSQKKDQNDQINLYDIEDRKLEEIAKTGLFAMEASGDLGGTFGAEIEANKLKYALANAQTNKEAAAIRATMQKMGYSNVSQYDPFTAEGEPNPNYNSNLGFDPTGILSFGEVESNDDLYDAYKGLQNKNASAAQLKTFLPSVYGYKSAGLGSGGFGGGYGGYGGGGGGGDGGSSGGPPPRGGMPQGNPNDMFGAMSPLQQAMINTNAAKSFSQGYKRGGIVTLVC
jgi:hypothetical protein